MISKKFIQKLAFENKCTTILSPGINFHNFINHLSIYHQWNQCGFKLTISYLFFSSLLCICLELPLIQLLKIKIHNKCNTYHSSWFSLSSQLCLSVRTGMGQRDDGDWGVVWILRFQAQFQIFNLEILGLGIPQSLSFLEGLNSNIVLE